MKPEEREALRTALIKRARELGFDDVGFCTAAPFDEWNKNAYDALKLRISHDPKTVMPGARSIAVAVRRYAVYGPWPEGSASVANYYVSSEAAYENVKPLAELIRSFGYSAIADPPIPEKQAALRAGMGTQGLNTQFCHHEFGILVNLHSILTDAPLAEADSPRAQYSACGLCAAACPTGALHDGIFDRERCLRYHMISGNPAPMWIRGLMGTRLLGCTECQHACPKAQKKITEVPAELSWACDIAGLLSGDKARYDRLAEYVGTNFARKKRILAQAALCAGNSGNSRYVPLLIPLLADDYTVVRSHAAWALGKLGGPEARGALAKALAAEADEAVRKEIGEALKIRTSKGKGFMGKGIALAGTLCVDYLKQVNGYPLPGMLSTILSVSRATGGAVPNMGIVLKRMDADLNVRAAGLVGDDENGEYALSVMASAGMDVSGIRRVSGEATAFTDAMLDARTGERTFFTMKGACAKFGIGDINFDALAGCSVFHIAYALLLDTMDAPDKEFGTVMARALREASRRGFITSMDVVSEQGDRFARVVTPSLPHCDYLIVNEIEASGVCGIPARDASGRILQANMEPICRALLDAGVRRLAAVHAPEGGWCMEKGGRFSYRPSLLLTPEYIKSTVGAGDAFCAGMLYALNRGDSAADALDFGAGTAACLIGGAGMKPAGEIERMLREMPRREN